MSTINTKRCLKNVKRNEGVVMVTYSTMSCFGLPIEGCTVNRSFLAISRQGGEKTSPPCPRPWAGAAEEEGDGGEVWQFTEGNPAPSQCIPFPLPPNLFACVLSYFLQLLIVWTERF